MNRTWLALGFCLLTAPALAQTTPRVTISAGAAAQPSTVSFVDVTSFPYFAETARVEGRYDVGDGVAVDVGGTVRVWKPLGIRANVTYVTRSTDSETRGSFPHPFFFNQNRTGTWTSADFERREVGLHISAAFDLVQNDRFSAGVFAGPSVFNFKQSVVESVEVIQSFPYDSIDARLVSGTVDGTAVGFHGGFDVGWYFGRHVGVGGLIRYAAGKKEARVGDGEPFDVELGGFQGGGGIRLRF